MNKKLLNIVLKQGYNDSVYSGYRKHIKNATNSAYLNYNWYGVLLIGR